MNLVLTLVFSLSLLTAFFAMVGYPLLLKLLDWLIKPDPIAKDTSYEPTVTYMIVAHNEEKVIKDKLLNSLQIEYPSDKLEVLVAADNCTDATCEIVKEFSREHPEMKLTLYQTKERKGKTNAQNEAQKLVTSELLVMTDANSMVKADAVRELVTSFSSDDIVYVCGKLVYNNSDNLTADSESSYWDIDLAMRDIESRFKTITAGNGALYACRNDSYIDFPSAHCHDSSMPYEYAIRGKRCLFEPKAVAVEKAGENDSDEFGRKVRMNRIIPRTLANGFKILNVFKYGYFSLFFFGHRICRYSLWIAHLAAFIAPMIGGILGNVFWLSVLAAEIVAYALAVVARVMKPKSKLLRLWGYYVMTVAAQLVGVFRVIVGKSNGTWEKAESTR